MATGSVQMVLVCVPTGGGVSVAPCASVGPQAYAPAQMQAYVVDPSVTLDSVVQTVPFNYTSAAGAFAFALTMVVTFWLAAKPVGAILGVLRKG